MDLAAFLTGCWPTHAILLKSTSVQPPLMRMQSAKQRAYLSFSYVASPTSIATSRLAKICDQGAPAK
jgi:hypothetical protein